MDHCDDCKYEGAMICACGCEQCLDARQEERCIDQATAQRVARRTGEAADEPTVQQILEEFGVQPHHRDDPEYVKDVLIRLYLLWKKEARIIAHR